MCTRCEGVVYLQETFKIEELKGYQQKILIMFKTLYDIGSKRLEKLFINSEKETLRVMIRSFVYDDASVCRMYKI